MDYCQREDVALLLGEEMLIELTDSTRSNVADERKISRAIASAGHAIDGYLRGGYTLPLETVPPILTDVAVDLVNYRLHKGREIPDDVTEGYKNAITTLRGIQEKRILLFDVTDPDDEPASTDEIVIVSRDREFTDDMLAKM